jgi:hypothetical protein
MMKSPSSFLHWKAGQGGGLEEAFAEGIVTGHPSMPEFVLDPGQVADLIAHLKTLD